MGIPLLTALEVLAIWFISVLLALPELFAFTMHQMDYRNTTLNVCFASSTIPFLQVKCSPILLQPTQYQLIGMLVVTVLESVIVLQRRGRMMDGIKRDATLTEVC